MKLSTTLKLSAMALAMATIAGQSDAQQAPAGGAPAGGGRAAPGLQVHSIVDGKLYWVEGGGGNSTVIIGDAGVVVVDAKTTPEAGAQLVAAVAKLTPKPIDTVIETHSDGDHVNGIVSFPKNIKIIAHANNKMEQLFQPIYAAVEVNGGKCLPPPDRVPNELIIKDRVSTSVDGVRMVFHHFGPAHTNGDLVIELPDYKIAVTGDLITNSVLAHAEKMGSLDGWFVNAKGLLALNVDRYIGGHANDLDTKETLRKRVADNQAIKDQVDGMVTQGKSLQEINTAMNAKDTAGCRGLPYWSLPQVEYYERTNKDQELK